MTRRPMLAVQVLAMTAVVAALIAVSVASAGARTAGTRHIASARPAGVRPHTAGSAMHMAMPAADAIAAAKVPATRELHRSVVHVVISNFKFVPRHLVVSPGTRIVWTNKDSDPHTVTSDHPAFHSEAIDPNGHYTLVAKRTGSFAYHCQIHPFMHGLLVVQH